MLGRDDSLRAPAAAAILADPTAHAPPPGACSDADVPDTSMAAAPPRATPPIVAPAAPAPRAPLTSGLVCVLLSSIAFSLMSLCVNVLAREPAPVSPLLSVIVRFFFQASLTVAAILVLRRGRLRERATWLGKSGNQWKLFLRGGWGICGVTAWFTALSWMSFSDATAITYLNIPLTALFASRILGEPFTRADMAGGALAVLGEIGRASCRERVYA